MLATACHGQTITQLGVLPGGSQSYAEAISADGTTVTGRGDSSDGIGTSVFRWTRTGGMQNLGRFPGDIHASGTAISADGSVIAGISDQAGAFRWTAASGLQSIAVPASTAYGMSADGRAIVGYGGMYGGVFRWSVASGYENLDGNQPTGSATWGYATSADGSAVVGFTEARATVWRSVVGTGAADIAQDLGVLVGGRYSIATAISGDGAAIAGYGETSVIETEHALRWTISGGHWIMRDLGAPGDAYTARGLAISGDGAIIVGSYQSATTGGALLWTAATGALDLNVYLASRGVDLAGWHLGVATGISADGTAITGTGAFDGNVRAFLVTGLALCRADSCPADINCSAHLETQDIFDYLNAWFGRDPRADFNALGGITVQDLFDFLNAWFSGC